jgi:hypothetical protein
MKKAAFLFFALAVSAANITALTLDEVLPGLSPADRRELLSEKELVSYTDSSPDFRYLPKTALAEQTKTNRGYSPNVCDEPVSLPLPKKARTRHCFSTTS